MQLLLHGLSGHLRALRLDVAGLMAPVAGLLVLGSSGALLGQMSGEAAVVALGTVDTVARHVSKTAARVAGLLALVTTATAATALVGAGIRAVPGNMTGLAALVALASGAALHTAAAATTNGRGLAAITRDVAGLSAAVACLVPRILVGRSGAVAAHMALLAAVVASRGSLLGAVTGLVSKITASEAGAAAALVTSARVLIHLENRIDLEVPNLDRIGIGKI